MANKLNNTRHLNIALLGGDHFARQDRRVIKKYCPGYADYSIDR